MKLGMFEGYCHPVMGKNNLLCSSCYDKISLSVEKWREFVLSNSFNNETANITLKDIKTSFTNLITKTKKPKTYGVEVRHNDMLIDDFTFNTLK